jgi:branched-chain amino acid transport system permease protein
MVYGIINLINFAHGDVLMVGALTSWTVIVHAARPMPGMPGWLLLIVAAVRHGGVCGAELHHREAGLPAACATRRGWRR